MKTTDTAVNAVSTAIYPSNGLTARAAVYNLSRRWKPGREQQNKSYSSGVDDGKSHKDTHDQRETELFLAKFMSVPRIAAITATG